MQRKKQQAKPQREPESETLSSKPSRDKQSTLDLTLLKRSLTRTDNDSRSSNGSLGLHLELLLSLLLGGITTILLAILLAVLGLVLHRDVGHISGIAGISHALSLDSNSSGRRNETAHSRKRRLGSSKRGGTSMTSGTTTAANRLLVDNLDGLLSNTAEIRRRVGVGNHGHHGTGDVGLGGAATATATGSGGSVISTLALGRGRGGRVRHGLVVGLLADVRGGGGALLALGGTTSGTALLGGDAERSSSGGSSRGRSDAGCGGLDLLDLLADGKPGVGGGADVAHAQMEGQDIVVDLYESEGLVVNAGEKCFIFSSLSLPSQLIDGREVSEAGDKTYDRLLLHGEHAIANDSLLARREGDVVDSDAVVLVRSSGSHVGDVIIEEAADDAKTHCEDGDKESNEGRLDGSEAHA